MGIHKTRTVARKPGSERFPREDLQMAGGSPWQLCEYDSEIDGEVMKMNVVDEMRMKEEVEE